MCVWERTEAERERKKNRQRENARQLPCNLKTWTQTYTTSLLPHSLYHKVTKAFTGSLEEEIYFTSWQGLPCSWRSMWVQEYCCEFLHPFQNRSKEENYNGYVSTPPCICVMMCEWVYELSHYCNNYFILMLTKEQTHLRWSLFCKAVISDATSTDCLSLLRNASQSFLSLLWPLVEYAWMIVVGNTFVCIECSAFAIPPKIFFHIFNGGAKTQNKSCC